LRREATRVTAEISSDGMNSQSNWTWKTIWANKNLRWPVICVMVMHFGNQISGINAVSIRKITTFKMLVKRRNYYYRFFITRQTFSCLQDWIGSKQSIPFSFYLCVLYYVHINDFVFRPQAGYSGRGFHQCCYDSFGRLPHGKVLSTPFNDDQYIRDQHFPHYPRHLHLFHRKYIHQSSDFF
jgi:hypothetical protein